MLIMGTATTPQAIIITQHIIPSDELQADADGGSSAPHLLQEKDLEPAVPTQQPGNMIVHASVYTAILQ